MIATGAFSDGTAQNLTSACSSWQSDNVSVLTISGDGLITAQGSGSSTITASCQGMFTLRLVTLALGARTSFAAGQYLVGADIAAGRYFTDPLSGCYWERQSGLGGTAREILSSEFVAFTARQWIVDILSTDRAFETDAECNTWSTSPYVGLQADIRPGVWLVGSQIPAGRYQSNVSAGCYWERMRHFQGTTGGVLESDFVRTAGPRQIEIRASDVGFQADDDCGTWTRMSTLGPELRNVERQQPNSEIELNWESHRRKNGPRYP
jgi:hypothetical protein